jgi:hypothetical protein
MPSFAHLGNVGSFVIGASSSRFVVVVVVVVVVVAAAAAVAFVGFVCVRVCY